VRWQNPKLCEPDGFGPHVVQGLRVNKVHPVGFLGDISLVLSFGAQKKVQTLFSSIY